jgi:hypothetical protein
VLPFSPVAVQGRVWPAVVDAFNNAHEITDGIDMLDYDVSNLDAGYLIFNRNHEFEAIEPIGSEVVAEARFISQTICIDSEMTGNDIANLAGKVVIVIHDASP